MFSSTDMQYPKVIASKPILSSTLFTVVEKKLELANGKKVVYQDIERHPTVVVFPITPTYEVYLISEYRYLHKKRLLEAMAGFINPGESVLSAAKRELQEETGIIAQQWEQLVVGELSASVISAKVHIFLAKDLTFGKATPEEDEDIELVSFPLEEAVEKVMTGEISTTSTMVGLLFLDRLRKEKKL